MQTVAIAIVPNEITDRQFGSETEIGSQNVRTPVRCLFLLFRQQNKNKFLYSYCDSVCRVDIGTSSGRRAIVIKGVARVRASGVSASHLVRRQRTVACLWAQWNRQLIDPIRKRYIKQRTNEPTNKLLCIA